MNIGNFFSSLRWPWSECKCNDNNSNGSGEKPSEPAIPSLDPPLYLDLSDGWDKTLDHETDIEVVRAHNAKIDAVRRQAERVEDVGNAIAPLDNGPKDHNKTPGKVLVEGRDIPGVSRRPESAFIEFDEQHRVMNADIRYKGYIAGPHSGSSGSKYLYSDKGEGNQDFTHISGGWSYRSGDRYRYEDTRVTSVDSEGGITQTSRRED